MVLKNSVLLAILSFLSLLFGVVRDRLLAHYVGIGATLDVYNASFRIPDLMLGVMISFAGALTVVPFIAKAIQDNNKKELEERFSSLIIFFGSIMCVLAVLVIIFIPYFAQMITPGFTSEQIISFIFYTRILMVQPLLLGLSALISTLAQAKHQFILYGSAPIIYTLGIIVSIMFWYQQYGLTAIIVGVVAGSLGHMLLQSLTLYHHSVKISFSRFKWSLIKEQLVISLPRSMSQVVSQLRIVFFTGFATTLGPGVLSIYVFAQRISDSAVQIISQSTATATLPILSSLYVNGDAVAYKATFKKSLSTIFLITLGSAVVCGVFSSTIVYILYGNITGGSDIARLLTILSIDIPFYALNIYFMTAFHSMKDSRTPLVINIITTLIAVVACLTFREIGFGLMSIGYGILVSGVFYTGISFFFFSKKKHLFG